MGYMVLGVVAVVAFAAGVLTRWLPSPSNENYAFNTTFAVYDETGDAANPNKKKRPKRWIRLVWKNPHTGAGGRVMFENYLSQDITIKFPVGDSPFAVHEIPVPAAGTSGPHEVNCPDPGKKKTKKFDFEVKLADGTTLDPGVRVRRG